MANKKYEVLKDFYLIQAFYPKGSTLETDEVTAKEYIDMDVLKEVVVQAPVTPQVSKPIKVTLKTDKGTTAIYTSEDGVDFEVAKTEVATEGRGTQNGVLKETSRKVYEAAKKKKEDAAKKAVEHK